MKSQEVRLHAGSAADTPEWLAFAAQHRALRAELEDVLIYQAALLDESRLEEWLALLAEDVHYIAPVRIAVHPEPLSDTGGARICHFNDTKGTLALRVGRIQTGVAYYNEVHTLLRNMVFNVRILDVDGAGSTVKVASSFIVYRAREHKEECLFVGGRTDTWRRGRENNWQLIYRWILLDHHIVAPLSVLF